MFPENIDVVVCEANGYVGFLMDQLFDIPRRIQKTQINHPDIFPDVFHLLQIPQWEGVIITIGKDDTVGLTTLKDVVRIIPGHIVAGPIMRMIVEGQHIDRHHE